LRARAGRLVAWTLVSSLLLTLALAAGPAIEPARAASGADVTTLGLRELQRTNQVLAIAIAFLKLLDELAALPHDGSPPPPTTVPPPPPSGGSGGGPGPYPVLAPDDPPLALCPASR
jgi:hypothetical protein